MTNYLEWGRVLIRCMTLLLIVLCVFGNVAHAQPVKMISIYVTVDWEGESLAQENLEAMQAFRKRFPSIPLLQLMNPTYFVGDFPKEPILASIRSTMLPIDTVGLHLHGWKSLLNACKIPYQNQPSYASEAEACAHYDKCGYTVSLEYAYTQEALTDLVECSNRLLMENGFGRARHFRAGGWQFGPKLQAALEKNGFVWDSSRINPDLLLSRWHVSSPMIQFLQRLHADPNVYTQPYSLTTTLIEYPNNGSLADYTSSKQIVEIFKAVLNARGSVLVLGFHQETAADYLVNLMEAIPKLEREAKLHGVRLEWVSQ